MWDNRRGNHSFGRLNNFGHYLSMSAPLSPAQAALCAYLVQAGLLPAHALADPPLPNAAVSGAAEQLAHALARDPSPPQEAAHAPQDWHRNFGLHLLPRNDPAFADPAYLLEVLRSATPDDPGWRPVGEGPRSAALQQWLVAWEALAPGTEVVGFTQTGSEAVGICFDIARRCGRARLHGAGMSQDEALRTQPGMAFFDGSFGGGRGEAAGMNTLFRNTGAPNLQAWRLPDAAVTNPQDLSAEQTAAVLQMETAALQRLEHMLHDPQAPLGAIYLEVIQGARGAYFYRAEFLAALRQFGDQHNVPLLDDEVLSVARTGRFFAWEHYAQHFRPDFIVFGKGMELAGVARVQRGAATLPCMGFINGYVGFVTARYPSRQQLLKSRQILLAIAQRGLLEQSARAGTALVAGLRALEAELGFTPTSSGQGMLIGVSHLLALCGFPGVVSAITISERPRILPPITLDDASVQAVLQQVRARLWSPDTTPAPQPVARGVLDVEALAQASVTEGLPYPR